MRTQLYSENGHIFVFPSLLRYWDYYEKVLEGPRPLLAPAGILLADNVLFHELVPLAEASLSAPNSPGNLPTAKKEGERPRRDGASLSAHNSPGNFPAAKKEGEGPRCDGAVGSGLLAVTPRRMKIAESLDIFNKKVRDDCRVEVVMLPLRDGLSVVRWRDGGYPDDARQKYPPGGT